MADIFISYAHKDQKRALVIGSILREMGWDIWQDVHNLRAMESFTEEIESGIRNCSIFLMLYSKAYHDSTYCGKEFSYAVEVHQKNEACIILDDDCPWINSLFGFHFGRATIPGYGKRSESEADLRALCDQITNSGVFIALKNLRNHDKLSILPPVPFEDRPKIRLRNSFDIAVRQLGQYRQQQDYEVSLALRFVKDTRVAASDDEESRETEDLAEHQPTVLSGVIPVNKPSRIVISGNGGLGKTTAMLEYGRKILDSQPVVYVHLSDVRFDRPVEASQYNHIESFIHERICAKDETWSYLWQVGHRLEGEGLNVTILLDGINELPGISMQKAIDEIANMAEYWKYTNLIVSTRNPAVLKSTRLGDFEFYAAVPPSEVHVIEYLKNNGIDADHLSPRVMNLLQNPLRLMIYVQTQPNYDYYKKMPGLKMFLHQEQDTVGKILDNYLASQLYHFLDACELDEVKKPQISAFVLSEIVVPYIAWIAYRQNRFDISESEFRKIMRGLEKQLPDLWEDYKNQRLEDLVDSFRFRDDYVWNYRDAVSVMEGLSILQQIEGTDGEKSYVFSHQSFRDYYAARFLAVDLKLYLRQGKSYSGDEELTLSSVELTDDIIELLSDVMEEERAKPYCDQMNGWQFPGKKKGSREASSYSCAEQTLCCIRERFDERAGTAVKNLMNILRYARGRYLAMCCFDGLDFSKCSLQHDVFSLWFRDQLCTSTFDGAYMNSNAFFCQAHRSRVQAVCVGSHGRILSGDADGELLETDAAEGIVTGKWTLPEKNIRAIAWNATSEQAAVITPHSLYLFDKKTEVFHLIIHQVQRVLQKVRFSRDGEVEYAVDIYPMVWFRSNGHSPDMENRPRWLSGAYTENVDGSRYWRSCLSKHLYTGKRDINGSWDEIGGAMSEIYSPHVSNCVRLSVLLTKLESAFPMTAKARKSIRSICDHHLWKTLKPDPELQTFRMNLKDYLYIDENNDDTSSIPQMAEELKNQIHRFLVFVPSELYICKMLSALEERFPEDVEEAKRLQQVCENDIWECSELKDNMNAQSLREKLNKYLFRLKTGKMESEQIQRMADALKQEVTVFLSKIPTVSGKRISCIELSPAGECIIICCGNVVMELNADTLKLHRMITLAGKVESVCYLPNGADDAYAAIGWDANVSVLNREFKIVSTCYGQIPPRKVYSWYDSLGRFYLLCSDRVLRRLDEEHRVERTRLIAHNSISRFFDPCDGTGLQIAYPMMMMRWKSGERYDFETNESYPLKDQYYQREHVRKMTALHENSQKNTVYFLDRFMQVISRDSNKVKEIRYASGLCIFGCSFRNLKGGITDAEKEILYMNGGNLS